GGVLCGKLTAIAGTGFAAGIRGRLFNKIQEFSFYNVDKYSNASLVTRLTHDVTSVQNAFMMIIRSLVRSPSMLIFATIMAIRINGPLSLIFAVAIPVLLVSFILIFSQAQPRFKEMLHRYDDINADVQENLTSIRTVKAFVREDHENEKFKKCSSAVKDTQLKAERLVILNGPIMQLCMYGCMLAVYFFGARFMVVDGMQQGDILSFMTYITQILMSLMMLAFASIQIIMARASLVRINEIFEEVIDISDKDADPQLKVNDGSVEFKDVKFSYSKSADSLIFDGLNLSIVSGETVGIIGGTGSAKSSLVNLIPRLYDVNDGAVMVGGRDVREYTLDNLRDAVSVVLQKNELFSGTIKENLLWGNENATDEEVENACRWAQAHDFIVSFPDGYQTLLGQGGVNVSGGQKQRLCIARALLKNPKILILDDSTSAVDTATDAKIREAFRLELPGVTKIIIAQRIGSVIDADKIVVLDDGKIVGVGNHDELMQSCEIYREVYNSQNKGGNQ
ncbi:MAG: ABC transporter ATP-binding protein, partial [Clostridia bacterium]|nr:ABC transporter ATP-binding protein [Clostridia bacterium]